MMRWIPTASSPIGIDITARDIQAFQLRRGKAAPRASAMVSISRMDQEGDLTPRDLDRLTSVLYRQGFIGSDIVLAVPENKLLSAMMELPPRNGAAPFEQIARMEFARINKCEPAGFEMEVWDLPSPPRASKTTGVMAVACKHTDAEAIVAQFESVGFDVRRLDTRACAACRALAPILCDKPSESVALLDLGWSSSSLSLVRHGVIVYERALPDAGIRRLEQTLAKQFDPRPDIIEYFLHEVGFVASDPGAQRRLPEAASALSAHFDEVIKDLRASISYAVHQYPDAPVHKLLVIGAGAAIPGLQQHLSTTLGIAAQVAAPGHLIECPPTLTGASNPIFTAALGLALARS